MKKILMIFMIGLLSGCASVGKVAVKNRENFLNLEKGMSRRKVCKLMNAGHIPLANFSVPMIKTGDPIIRDTYVSFRNTFSHIDNPMKTDVVIREGKRYVVDYYLTGYVYEETEISNSDLMPIIFKDNKFVAWGWGFLRDAKKLT